MEKITDAAIRQSIESTLIETFDAMMSLALEVADTDVPADLDQNRVVGAIHFGGEVVGVMSFSLSEKLAQTVAAAMRDSGADEIDSREVINDAIAELVNILAGNLKTEFLDSGLACIISTPSITSGSDFKIDPVAYRPTSNIHLSL